MDTKSILKNSTLKGRYRVDNVLGRGGFSITYKGWDLQEGQPVAIKEYYPGGFAVRDTAVSSEVNCPEDSRVFEENKKRFLREASVMAQFREHEQIVKILDYFEENHTAYIVMEYVDGITLKEYVCRKGGKISWEETREIARTLIKALIPLHNSGIIHRDLSPENIMILPDGGLKILDFGAVKRIDKEMEVGRRLTIPTEAIVKQGYAPIEQYQNHGNLGPWTDVYALCATICYCLTGSVPLDAPARIVTPVSVELIARGAAISEKEEAAVVKGMELLIQDRIQSMEELYEELFVKSEEFEAEDHQKAEKNPKEERDTETGNDSKAEKDSETGKRRNRVVFAWAAGAALLIAAIVTVIAVLMNSGRYVLREGDDLAAQLNRKEVKEIIIPPGIFCTVAEVTVDKRVTVEDGASLSVGNLTVTESGCVKVEGTLDIGSAVMHLLGAGVRVEIADGGKLASDKHTLVWTESADNLRTEPGSEEAAAVSGNRFLFDEEETFRDAVSVTTYEELQSAMGMGLPATIDADMEFPEQVNITSAVRVSENVTLTRRNNDWIAITDGAVFVNRGTVKGGITIYNRGCLLNYGYLDLRDEYSVSLWLEGDGALVNLGTLDAYNVSRVWGDAQLYNVSLVNAYHLYLLGGSMINAGEIRVYPTPAGMGTTGLVLSNASTLYNKGSLTAESDSRIENYGMIENTGSMYLGERVEFSNSVLHNEGYFESDDTAKMNGVSGIYYGSGEFRLQQTSGLHLFEVQEAVCPADIIQVKTEEELYSALERDDVTQILIQGEIHVTQDLSVKKELFIEGDLTVEEGNCLALQASRMILLRGGCLTAEKVSLLGQAQMIMEEGAQLNIPESGELRLRGQSLILCRSGNLSLDQVYLEAADASGLVMLDSEMSLNGTEIRVLDEAVFVDAGCSDRYILDLNAAVEDGAELHFSGNVILQNAEITVENGSLVNSARDLEIEQSTIYIGELGNWYNEYSPFRMNEITIRNEGGMRAYGWMEGGFTMNSVNMVNTGYMDFVVLIEIDENSVIENNGTYYKWFCSDEEREQLQRVLKGNEIMSW